MPILNSNIHYRRFWRFFLLVFTFISMLTFSQVALCADEPLIIGIFPRRNLVTTIEIFTPMADYLSVKLKRKVTIVSTKNFEEFWNKVERRQFDIVHYNQYHYVRSHKEFGYKVILKNGSSEKTVGEKLTNS